jgi:predicted TIM-barrel fold metal-dependent hydrolase
MNIIDSHNHIWPDKVVLKAKSSLENSLGRKLVDIPTEYNLLKNMDKAGISKSIIAGVATRPDQVKPINNWLFSISKSNKRILPFACLHPFYNEYKDEIKRIKDNAQGIKLQPETQEFFIDDEKVFHLYEQMQNFNIPLLLHCGRELKEQREEDIRSTPDRLLKVINQFPNLTIIAAHMGGFLMWEDVVKKLNGENLYFDTACSIANMPIDLVNKYFNKYGFDKIIYGSDYPMTMPKEEIDFINSLNIADSDKSKILGQNIGKLLKLSF